MPEADHDIRHASSLLQNGEAAQAESLLACWCEASPGDGWAWFLLGAARHQQGRLEGALAAFEQSIHHDPSHPQALSARAHMLALLGRVAEAVEGYRECLRRSPLDAQLHVNLAIVLEQTGSDGEALTHYESALRQVPDYAPALMNRGVLLIRLERLEEALANNDRLAAAHPDLPDAHFNRAEVLLALHRFEPALAAADRALSLHPGHLKAAFDRGLALAALGRLDESQTAFEAARALDPEGFAALHSPLTERVDPRLIYLQMAWERQMRCDWSDRERYVDELDGYVDEATAAGRAIPERALVFQSLSLPLSPATRLSLATGVARAVQATALREAAPFTRWSGTTRRLRVGYLSPNFTAHPNALLMRRVYALHDRAAFDIVGYSLHPDDGSGLRRDIEQSCDVFRELHGLAAVEAAQRIHADGIQVLVDLAGYTSFAHSEILALRPAPVQVNHMGLQGTMGADFVQYRLTDALVTPAGSERWWREKLVFLPHTYFTYDDAQPIAPDTPPRHAHGLPEEGFVFCAFNNAYKLEPVGFAVWMDLLSRLPGSVLWLLDPGPQARGNLCAQATVRGVDPRRLVFAPRVGLPDHLARQRLADLFLDTFIYNAHTTACDALWAGLPLLTFLGQATAGRIAASLLHAVGLPELVTDSPQAYLAKALHLATHPDRLRAMRDRLATSRQSHPLFDTERTVRYMEAAYRIMWERHAAGLAPASFSVR